MTKRTFLFIDVTVKLIEPLHISGKSDPFTTAHNRMTRVGDDVVIPGPSFKGALRFSLERLLSANYSQKEWMKPCLPATGRNTSDDEKTLKNQRKYRNNPCSYEKNSRFKCIDYVRNNVLYCYIQINLRNNNPLFCAIKTKVVNFLKKVVQGIDYVDIICYTTTCR